MDWTKEATIQIIDLFREKEVLWNSRHPDYKNRQLKYDAWHEIATLMEMTKDAVEKKMRSLIGQFQREQKKPKSGAGASEVYETKWFAFKSMLFLKDKNQPRKTLEGGIQEDDKTNLEVDNRNTVELEASDSQHADNTDNNIEIQQPQLQPQSTGRRVKRKVDTSKADEAYEILTNLKHKSRERDEYSVYGEHIACTIRKLATPYARSTVQHHINNMLYLAELGNYDKPPSRIHLPPHQYQQSLSHYYSPAVSPPMSSPLSVRHYSASSSCPPSSSVTPEPTPSHHSIPSPFSVHDASFPPPSSASPEPTPLHQPNESQDDITKLLYDMDHGGFV